MQTMVYQEFKNVMEMAYIMEKAQANKERWSTAEREIFEDALIQNFWRMQKNKTFQKEYKLYEEASAQGQIITPPQNTHQATLNKILKEIENIKLACQPYRLDNKEILRKQADIRLKYEKALRANKEKNITKNRLLKNKQKE